MKSKLWFLIIILLIWIFSYFAINQFVSNTDYFYDYSIFLDDFIPLIPFFVGIYISSYILMFVIPLLFENRKAYFYAFVTLIALTAPFFIFLPGIMIRPEILGKDIFSWALNIIYSLDNPHNLFPSSHISISVLNALIMNNKWVYLWAFLIILSTLFVKQHYILDVLGGILVAIISFLVYNYFKKH